MMESEFPAQLKSQVNNVLNSNDNTPMDVLFENFFSRELSLKSHAQTFFECAKKHNPDLLFIKLCFLFRCSPNVETRANAIKVLRFLRICDLWPKLRQVAQSTLKAHFLAYLNEETSMPVLRMFCVVLAETVSEIYKAGNQWPELLEFLFRSIGTTNDERSKEISLSVLAHLPRDCRPFICVVLKNNVQALHSLFLSGLASSSPDLQVAAFGAVVSLVPLFSDASSQGLFHDLLRAMMVGIFTLLSSFQNNYAHKAFEELITLVSEGHKLLKPYMNDMVLDMLQIAENSTLSEGIHCSALRLVISMTESKDFKPILLSLPHQTMVRLLLVPMKMLLCVDELVTLDESKSEEDENTGKINVYQFGLRCLYRLSTSLGENKVMPVALEMLPNYLDSPEWKKRHAGIIMLTVMAKEYSFETILVEDFLGPVLAKILKLFQDSHSQVRRAAFYFMVLPTTFVQTAQILYHSRLLPAFVAALENEKNNKVKEQAASAMLFFLKNTLPDSLLLCNDVDIIMAKLLVLLQGNETAKQRSFVLSTFNIVAERCRNLALQHYVNYLPILLETCEDKNSEVKEEAIRGIRICAEFGWQQFKPFINRILSKLNILMQHPNQPLSENAKASDIAVSVLGRICLFHRDNIDASKLIPVWLSFLPLKDDLNEAKIMHEQLCFMVARLDNELLGPGNQNLVKIISVFVEVIDKGDNLATTETVKSMNHLLREFWKTIPPSSLDLILLSFNSHQQDLLLSLVSS